jgi:hypothetical protein
MSDHIRSASARRVLPLTIAALGALLAVSCAGALAIESYRARDVGNHECQLAPADIIRHHIAPESLQSSWHWLPPGVTCVYSTRDGGTIEYGPAPTGTILLLAGTAGAVAAPVGTLIHLARRHQERSAVDAPAESPT